MKYINKINSSAIQLFSLTGNAGQRIEMSLRYMPTQEAWFMGVALDGFTANGVRVVSSPNLLRKFRDIIPFGVSCASISGQDPRFIDDFSVQRASLFLMDEVDIIDNEDLFYS